MRAISLYVDGMQIKLPYNTIIQNPTVVDNFWINIMVALDERMVSALKHANTVGIIAQYTYEAATFSGFDRMDFTDGAKKLAGVLSTCH